MHSSMSFPAHGLYVWRFIRAHCLGSRPSIQILTPNESEPFQYLLCYVSFYLFIYFIFFFRKEWVFIKRRHDLGVKVNRSCNCFLFVRLNGCIIWPRRKKIQSEPIAGPLLKMETFGGSPRLLRFNFGQISER